MNESLTKSGQLVSCIVICGKLTSSRLVVNLSPPESLNGTRSNTCSGGQSWPKNILARLCAGGSPRVGSSAQSLNTNDVREGLRPLSTRCRRPVMPG